MLRRIALGLLAALTLTQAASARDRWISLRSAHLELYTTADEAAGRDALVFFEQVRLAFTDSLGLKLPVDKRITIIAFRDQEAYAPYRPQADVAAYTMAVANRDFIVMQDLVPEHYPVALHEFTHAVIEQSGMKLPLWLNEGFAEFYATMKPMGHKILVGRILPDRLQAVQSGLIALHEVLSADRQSAVYHDVRRSGLFHSESWALVHMLKFDEDYSPRFDRVLDSVGRGEESEKVLQTVYGKTTEQIQTDLQAYVHRTKFREGIIQAKLEKAIPAPTLGPVDQVDIAVTLAGIQARGPHRKEAVGALEDLARENPGNVAPLDAIAGIQIAQGDPQTAAAAFRRALEGGTRDATLCFLFAVKLRNSIPDADYVAALQRAVEIDPEFSTAQQLLAEHAFYAHDYAETVKRLHLVKKLDRANAFSYYRFLCLSTIQTGDLAEARSALARTQQYAVTPEEKQQAEEILKFLNSGAPATGSPRK